MNTRFFKIEVLSNLHVGSGEINYGLIDNLIQRDLTTELPNINSSSLKGALREYFKSRSKETNSIDINVIFGSDPKETDKKKRKQGAVRFFEAELIAIPVRDDKKPYKMVSCSEILQGLAEKIRTFRCEENEIDTHFIKAELGLDSCDDYSFEEFKNQCKDEELPVISRNNLENGQSANLWYEQVLPKHTILCFAIMGEGTEFNAFCDILDNSRVQIGANATIGYGYCNISEFIHLKNK